MRQLRITQRPAVKEPSLLLGFTGWMDGGDVSTGTVQYLADYYSAEPIAEIAPDDFYIYGFPGSMEVTALFRPHTRMEDGLVQEYEQPTNEFLCAPEAGLILFEGREPHLRWGDYAECIMTVVDAFDVRRICFVGSVGGMAPHTRDPRFYGSVSDPAQLHLLEEHNLRPSSYEGPASLVTYLMVCARKRKIPMTSMVAEIPAYFQGRNGRCIAAATRKVAETLRLRVDMGALDEMARDFERRLSESVREKPDLLDLIRRIEADYDAEKPSGDDDDDLRQWFESQGINLD